jgi:solute:Na+ symporter, SSS family
VTMSGLAIIVLIGRFWRRGTWQGALAALAVTPSVSLATLLAPVKAGYLNNAVIPALAGVIAHILVSLLTPRTSPGFDEVVETMNRQRQAVEGGPRVVKSHKAHAR